jgi:hypothetical protein
VYNRFISRKWDLNFKVYNKVENILKPIITLSQLPLKPPHLNGLLLPGKECTFPTEQPHAGPNLTDRLDQKQAGLIVDHKALDVGCQVNPSAPHRPRQVTRHFGPADLLLDHGL